MNDFLHFPFLHMGNKKSKHALYEITNRTKTMVKRLFLKEGSVLPPDFCTEFITKHG